MYCSSTTLLGVFSLLDTDGNLGVDPGRFSDEFSEVGVSVSRRNGPGGELAMVITDSLPDDVERCSRFSLAGSGIT